MKNHLNIGVIGLGRLGRVYAEGLAHHVPNANLKAVADLREDVSEAFARENLVKELWDYYWQKYNDENRIDLPKLSVLRYLALLDFLNDQQYPPNLRGGLLARMKVERPQLFEQLLKEEETRNIQQTQESSN